MMKKTVILLLTLLFVSAVLPAEDDVPALRRKLALLREAERIPVLTELAGLTAKQDPDEALRLAEEALGLAEKYHQAWPTVLARYQAGRALAIIGDAKKALAVLQTNCDQLRRLEKSLPAGISPGQVREQLVKSLSMMGDTEHEQQNFRTARAHYLEALAVRKADATLLFKAGTASIYLADYDGALAYLLEALATAEKTNNRKIITTSSYLIGYVHRDQEDYDQAMDYFNKARKSGTADNDSYNLVLILNEIGNIHLFQKKFAEARSEKEKALTMARTTGDEYLVSTCLHDLGLLFKTQGQVEKALSKFEESLAIDRRLGQHREMAITLENIASCLHLLKQNSRALSRLDEALSLARQTDLSKDISEIYLQYSGIYAEMKRYDQAYSSLQRHLEIKERLFNEEKSRQIAEMQTRYETEKKQRENEILKRDNQIAAMSLATQRGQRNMLFFLALLAALLAAVLYSLYHFKSRANRRLEEANGKIRSQQSRLEEAYRQMAALAREDALTGLPNRRVAMEEIRREQKRFRRRRKPFALIMIDVDGFKILNDDYGHDAGDEVLKNMAALFRRALRTQDTVARWGGDEFLILLPETGRAGAEVTVRNLRRRVSNHRFQFHRRRLPVSISAGIGLFRAEQTITACLRQADQEMYRSRRGRR